MQYMGSKNKYAKELLPIILKDKKPEQWYVEPFCGGCNLIDKVEGPRIANDVHPFLIELLKHIQNNGELINDVSEELYAMVKNNPNVFKPWFVGFVGFGCSFGSKWFGGYARNKNNTNYALVNANNLRKQADNLKGVLFENADYRDLRIPPESIIYFDPPYKGTTKYTGVNSFDTDAFWKYVRDCWIKGHQVFISEYTAPADFVCVWEKKVVSNLHHERGGSSNKYETEKLFTYCF